MTKIIYPDDLDHFGKCIKYPQLRFGIDFSNLGTSGTQDIFNLWNFSNSQFYQKLNVRECWRINYLMFIGHCGVLRVPRLLHGLFSSILSNITYFLEQYYIILKVRFDNFGICACYKLMFFMAQDLGFSILSTVVVVPNFLKTACWTGFQHIICPYDMNSPCTFDFTVQYVL